MRIGSECRLLLAKGKAYNWGDTIPKIGDRVVNLGTASDHPEGVWSVITKVLPAADQDSDTILYTKTEDKGYRSIGWCLWRFAPDQPPALNMERTLITRGKHRVVSAEHRVVSAEHRGDFIMSVIQVGHVTLALRHSLSGRFIPHCESPMDLLEAK